MNDAYLDELDKRVAKACRFFSDSQNMWQELPDDPDSTDPESFESIASLLQLVLQYRLDGEDILAELLMLDHHLLYILGIQPQHSTKTNMDRLSYALGTDDLKAVLHALSQLVDSLLRIARRYQKQQERTRTYHSPVNEAHVSKRLNALQKLHMRQGIEMELIREIAKQLEDFPKAGAPDYAPNRLVALRSAISQWQLTIQEGLEQAQQVYHQANKGKTLDHSLAMLIQQADAVLKQIPSVYQPTPNHPLGQFANKSREELEQRAAAKRMRPFF